MTAKNSGLLSALNVNREDPSFNQSQAFPKRAGSPDQNLLIRMSAWPSARGFNDRLPYTENREPGGFAGRIKPKTE